MGQYTEEITQAIKDESNQNMAAPVIKVDGLELWLPGVQIEQAA